MASNCSATMMAMAMTEEESLREMHYDCLAKKSFSDGRVAEVIPLVFGRARLSVGKAGAMGYDDVW